MFKLKSMKVYCLVILLTGLFVFSFDYLDAKKITKKKGAKVVNWLLEDPTPLDGWEYCYTWQGEQDKIGTRGKNKNILVSTKEFYKGKSSLKLEISHFEKGYCGVQILTGADNKGIPAGSWDEANTGKDISNCDTLEFYIKAEGKAKVKNVKIEIMDTNDLTTDKLFLIDYIKPQEKWQKVQIPLDEFSWIYGFNKKSLKGITFMVEQNDPYGKYILYIDDLRFIKKGIKMKKRFKVIFEDDSIEDGAWNFSGSWEGNRSTIEKSDYYENIPISMKEKYKGYSSFKFHVNQKKGGWAGCFFCGGFEGKGIPPKNWEDLDTPKDISPYNTLQFWVKGEGRVGGRLELGDVNKNVTAKIEIENKIKISNKWQKVVIPFKEIKWKKFDKKKFKEIKLQVDDDYPEGEFTLYIDNLEFIKLP